MRIANKTLTDRFAVNVNDTLDKINKYNEQIASGKKVTAPSDAPDDISLILKFKRDLANLDQYVRNLDAGLSFVRASGNALLSSVKQGRLAKKLAIQAANDPSLFSDSSITGLLADIEGIKEEIRVQANTQLSGKYIFSGYSTKTSTFSTTSNGYRGDTFNILTKTGDDKTIPINVTGDVAFRESSITGAIDIDPTNGITIGGVTNMSYDNNIAATSGKLVTSVVAPGTYTGSSSGNYRIVVNTANTTIGEVGGLVLDLEFDNGLGGGYVIVNSVAAAGGVAATETITLTDSGLSFDVDVDLTNATTVVTKNDPMLANFDIVNFDVAGDVRFTVSDGTNTSAEIVFAAGTTYSAATAKTAIKTIIDSAISAGTPTAPTIKFEFDIDGKPVFSIEPRDASGMMEFTDTSVGTNQTTKGRIRDMFGISDGFKNIFGVLEDLQLAISEKSAEEVELVISRLDNVEGEMLKSESVLGARERSMINNKANIESVKDERIKLLSALEDSDPTEAITKLTNAQTSYDAILYYGALIQRKSLLDYIS